MTNLPAASWTNILISVFQVTLKTRFLSFIFGFWELFSCLPNQLTVTPYRAVMGNWTPDLFLTKEVLYHWATTADKPLLKAAVLSGRRGSNPRPIAWKAIALPTELLPQLKWKVQNRKSKVNTYFLFFHFRFSTFDFRFPVRCGQERIRTSEVERQRIYSPPHLAALEPAPMACLEAAKFINVRLTTLKKHLSEPEKGLEPPTSWLQISCSTSWATLAITFRQTPFLP